MNVAEQFNALNGKVATRSQLEKLADLSLKEEQFHIFERIQSVLSNNADKKFVINIHNKTFEIAPKSMLNGLHFEEMTDEENKGLNKPVSSSEIYQMITDKMLVMIKEASGKGYIRKWNGKKYGKGYTIPFNFDTKKRYRGVNVFLLTTFEPLENPFFMTFKQIEAHKGLLKKGSKGFPVIYFTNLYKITDKQRKIDFGTYDLKKAKEFAIKNGFSEDKIKTLPILKYYNVFNGKDIEGINFDLENFKIGYIEKELPNTEKLPIAEAIIKNYPSPAPKLKHGGNDAFYSPSADFIQMPHIADFETVQDYYRTLFHEFSHSTGAYNRLNRDFSGRFGSKPYAFEELVAEWGATFLSAEAGIIWHSNKNHAEYLKNWNSALTHLKDDNKFIMKACTKAQELTDFVLQLDDNGTPKYFEALRTEAPKNEVKKPVSKVKKTTKKIIEKSKKETKNVVKPSTKSISKVQKKQAITPKYKEKSVVVWEGRPVKVSKVIQFGNDLKFELDLGKNKTIWTDENTLDSEAKKGKAEKLKIDSKGQISLFGVKKVTPKSAPNKNTKVQKIGLAGNDQVSEFFTITGEVGKFLQQVERKPVQSVVITMDGEQGAGKTTTLYKFMEAFAYAGNKSLFLSLEEHPESFLAKDKVSKYLSIEAQENIDTVAEVESVNELYELISDYDIIFLDSWQKLQRMIGNIRLDEDLRKKFNGKVFVVIFQQTTTGRTKGGAEVVFDGDIIIKMVKEDSFKDNYAYFDKNRYTLIPIENIRYNIASGKTYNPNVTKIEVQKEKIPGNHNFSFVVN